MLEAIIEPLAHFVIAVISTLGYPGIILTMAIESALIPLPSEIIMPFSGYLVSVGRFDLFGVALAGAVGNLLGSWVAYALGFWGQERVVRRLIRKFGKFVLISEEELDRAISWFDRWGDLIVLVSRVLPAIRTFISLPAGIAKMNFLKFSLYTFFGSLIWSYFLAYIGKALGENWNTLGPIFHKADIFIIGGLVLLVGWYIWHKIKKIRSKLKHAKNQIES